MDTRQRIAILDLEYQIRCLQNNLSQVEKQELELELNREALQAKKEQSAIKLIELEEKLEQLTK